MTIDRGAHRGIRRGVRHRASRPGPMARRGVTFLEVVLGAVLLALVAGTLAGFMSSLELARTRQARKLGAAELANRLVIIYMNDKKQLPSRTLPIEYGSDLYRWSLDVTRARAKLSDSARAEGVGSTVGIDGLELVRVDVWLAEDSGGSFADDPDVPRFTLVRLLDGLIPKNPTAFRKKLEDPDEQQEFIESLIDRTEGRDQ